MTENEKLRDQWNDICNMFWMLDLPGRIFALFILALVFFVILLISIVKHPLTFPIRYLNLFRVLAGKDEL